MLNISKLAFDVAEGEVLIGLGNIPLLLLTGFIGLKGVIYVRKSYLMKNIIWTYLILFIKFLLLTSWNHFEAKEEIYLLLEIFIYALSTLASIYILKWYKKAETYEKNNQFRPNISFNSDENRSLETDTNPEDSSVNFKNTMEDLYSQKESEHLEFSPDSPIQHSKGLPPMLNSKSPYSKGEEGKMIIIILC